MASNHLGLTGSSFFFDAMPCGEGRSGKGEGEDKGDVVLVVHQ